MKILEYLLTIGWVFQLKKSCWKKILMDALSSYWDDPEIFFFLDLWKTFPENLKIGIGFPIRTKVTSFFHVIKGHVKVV